MIEKSVFDVVRHRYARQASWAIWGDFGADAKSNMEDISIFDDPLLLETLSKIHVNYVIVGLNISTKEINRPLSNFHGKNGEVYKLRFALHGTPLWGSYMTDILKDFPDPKSENIEKHLKTPSGSVLEKQNVNSFCKELNDIGASGAKLIALGRIVSDILIRNFGESKEIIQIPHYGYRVTKEAYRDLVRQKIKLI